MHKFKVDENLPIEVAELLAGAGHNASTVHDQQMVGEPDSTLSQVCQREDRAIITLDLDFSDIRTYPPAEHAGIIVLRPARLDKSHVLFIVERLLPILEKEPLTAKLWVVDESTVRVRG